MSGSLTPEQVKALLAKPEKKRGTRRKGPDLLDASSRTIEVWFSLATKSRDEELNLDINCDNPNCMDPRPARVSALGNKIKHQWCADINGQHCCRHCFLGGWLVSNPDQLKLTG